MTATDELRRLLDERGVAHSDHYLSTTWRDGHGIRHLAGEPMADGSLVVDMLTPEQAIAATLGGGECEDRAEAFTLLTNGTVCVGSKQLVARIAELQSRLNNVALGGGKLTAEQVRECVERVYLEGYSDGSVNRGAHIDETDWQAIADELNATQGCGECEVIQSDNGPKCSKCGKELPEDPYSDYEGNFCPTCGARIRKAVKR